MTPEPHAEARKPASLNTLVAALTLLSVPAAASAQGQALAPGELPKSRAELSNYEETSRYEDVIHFFTELQKRSPLIRLEYFGKTVEGRDMPLVILSDPPVSQPREAAALNKPIVFVMANIHAGEVEGKEAVQHFARRIVAGDLRGLLDKLVILIAPDYNADGNEKINLTNRSAQYGPINGAGVRENSKNLDLNRDYIKMEGPETQALIRLFNQWDPLMTVDLHTTNGSYHGYHLTYSIPLNPMTDGPIFSYHRETLMPAIADAMLKQHKWRTYYYGNFSQGQNPRASGFGASAASRPATSLPAPPVATTPAPAQSMAWFAFSHLPRVGQNYVGLRNRFTILSESYSYISFKDRIDSTADFVEEICRFTAAHGDPMRALARQADQQAVARGRAAQPFQLGVDYEQRALANPVELLVGDVTTILNPKNNRNMRAMAEDKNHPVKMLDYGLFAATRTVPAARAYLFRDEPGMQTVRDKLLAHGVAVETLTAPLDAQVDTFNITSVRKATIPFQGHSEVTIVGQFKPEKETFQPGTFVVRTAQPLGTLAAYLLEPESDDGFTRWNFLDDYLGAAKTHPVYKLMGELTASTKVLQPG